MDEKESVYFTQPLEMTEKNLGRQVILTPRALGRELIQSGLLGTRLTKKGIKLPSKIVWKRNLQSKIDTKVVGAELSAF